MMLVAMLTDCATIPRHSSFAPLLILCLLQHDDVVPRLTPNNVGALLADVAREEEDWSQHLNGVWCALKQSANLCSRASGHLVTKKWLMHT